YKTQGMDGLKRRKSKMTYSVQFKLDAIQFILETGASYPETAVQFQMNNPSMIQRWLKDYREQGIEGLKPALKEKSSMSKSNDKQSTREQDLERENELLRLENSYLKKLKAFRENSNALHGKHKLSWHSSSKRKDLN